MTPEERAAQIVAANDFLLELRDDDRVGLEHVMASAIREAEDAERERAAKIVEKAITHRLVERPTAGYDWTPSPLRIHANQFTAP